jgi:hypothetical protein
MENCNQSLTDAGESSETKPPRQLSTDPTVVRMRDYMRDRRVAKKFGWTVSVWKAAGSPQPGTSPDVSPCTTEAPVGPPDAA